MGHRENDCNATEGTRLFCVEPKFWCVVGPGPGGVGWQGASTRLDHDNCVLSLDFLLLQSSRDTAVKDIFRRLR